MRKNECCRFSIRQSYEVSSGVYLEIDRPTRVHKKSCRVDDNCLVFCLRGSFWVSRLPKGEFGPFLQ